MGWKNWPYWFRYGLLIGIIGAILSWIFILPSCIGGCYHLFIFPSGYFIVMLSLWDELIDSSISLLISSFVYHFVIGATIGSVVGKVKNRKIIQNLNNTNSVENYE